MTGNFWLDWLLLALSLFNVVVLLWLGLTVLLNVERRTGGVWLIGGAALLGSAFFAAHTAILSIASQTITAGLDFWWELGWLPLLALPLILIVCLLLEVDPVDAVAAIWRVMSGLKGTHVEVDQPGFVVQISIP